MSSSIVSSISIVSGAHCIPVSLKMKGQTVKAFSFDPLFLGVDCLFVSIMKKGLTVQTLRFDSLFLGVHRLFVSFMKKGLTVKTFRLFSSIVSWRPPSTRLFQTKGPTVKTLDAQRSKLRGRAC